jgi:hypothetical protein
MAVGKSPTKMSARSIAGAMIRPVMPLGGEW